MNASQVDISGKYLKLFEITQYLHGLLKNEEETCWEEVSIAIIQQSEMISELNLCKQNEYLAPRMRSLLQEIIALNSEVIAHVQEHHCHLLSQLHHCEIVKKSLGNIWKVIPH